MHKRIGCLKCYQRYNNEPSGNNHNILLAATPVASRESIGQRGDRKKTDRLESENKIALNHYRTYLKPTKNREPNRFSSKASDKYPYYCLY